MEFLVWSIYLERQVAQNNRPLYPKVAYNISKVAHNFRLLVAYNNGLLSSNYGLLLGIVACYFGLLGVPGICIPYSWKASGLKIWATFDISWASLGCGGLLVWATWRSRYKH